LLYDSTKKLGDNAGYSETVGKENGILKEDGYKLMEYLLNQ